MILSLRVLTVLRVSALALIMTSCAANYAQTMNADNAKNTRPRARDLGLKIGILPTGSLNAITDVAGVRVGHSTIIRGENIRTGVTAVLPHGNNLFQEKVPGAVFVGNGFGKLTGATQINELGEIETPILLTSTLSVGRVADFLLDYLLALPGNESVQSINPLIAETNDGFLNDIRGRHVSRADVFQAIERAQIGAVEEGSIGAGTGTAAFGFKGGIGTASRRLPASLGGFTIGVLVQTNFGGVLQIDGAPVGVELGKYYLKDAIENAKKSSKSLRSKDAGQHDSSIKNNDKADDSADGSIIIVIATDAPADARNLRRMAARSMMGLARTGAAGTNGSGDYAIAFSTAPENRIKVSDGNQSNPNAARITKTLPNDAMSPLFLAVIEATEEAIYNSLFRATTVSGKQGRTMEALPLQPVTSILLKYGKIK